jgi:sulfur-oxidizing protein SoxB
MCLAASAGLLPRSLHSQSSNDQINYHLPKFGTSRLLHFTDTHAQLLPIYFREPNVNIGVGEALGKPPHLVGEALLKHFNIPDHGLLAHAFTHLNYADNVIKYGKVGGFAHLATLIKNLRAIAGDENCLLLDGGDTWQGSGTALKTNGMDMVGACNLLGVDVMTGHWEFTYQDSQVLENIKAFNGDFIAQNVNASEEALFDGTEVFDEDSGHVFPPYTIKQAGNDRIAIIGQAFPYTPVANPKRFIPDWTFGIKEIELQTLINEVRARHNPDAVILLSHNGLDVDLKMAANVTGLDAIMGGHTHDGLPHAQEIKNSSGITLVTNAGSNGKFLGVMDLDIKNGQVRDYRYKLLPVFSNLITADEDMQAYIDSVRKPHLPWLTKELGTTEHMLYRRGNFNGTFDQLICDALRAENDAEIALSPGFRWGTTLPEGSTITMEHVLDQTCMTYPETYRREMTGADLKLILEDVCDNLFNPNPYFQQGGDMVRVGGMNYTCAPTKSIGHRISNMTLDSGKAIQPHKIYSVAGWATVNAKSSGVPVWEQVASYIETKKVIKIDTFNTPKLVGVDNNPGKSNYP